MPTKTLAELALQLELDLKKLKQLRAQAVQSALNIVTDGYKRTYEK